MEPISRDELTTNSEIETRELGRALAAALAPGDVISLTGDLGAGKTRFVQGVAAGLGVDEPVTSPTFTIMKIYEGRLPLYHFDVYRLQKITELQAIGYEEYFFGEGATIIEWGDKIREALPADYLRLEIHRDVDDIERRLLIVEASGERSQELAKTLAGAP